MTSQPRWIDNHRGSWWITFVKPAHKFPAYNMVEFTTFFFAWDNQQSITVTGNTCTSVKIEIYSLVPTLGEQHLVYCTCKSEAHLNDFHIRLEPGRVSKMQHPVQPGSKQQDHICVLESPAFKKGQRSRRSHCSSYLMQRSPGSGRSNAAGMVIRYKTFCHGSWQEGKLVVVYEVCNAVLCSTVGCPC